MKRFRFFEIFQSNPDGSLSPRRVVSINGVTFGPGVAFSRGVLFGGVNLFDYYELDIAVEEENNIYVIKGFYKKQ